MDDLYPPVGGGVWWFHDTTNHVFIVEWDSVAYYSPQTQWDKFEIMFYDTTLATADGSNRIVVQYQSANAYTSNTVGIQNQNYTIYINCLYNSAYTRGVAPITPLSAIKYIAERPVTGVAEPTGPQPLAAGIAFSVFPNPFRGKALVRCQIPAAGDVDLKVFDISGREVSTIYQGRLIPGRHTFNWNGTDDNGREVSAGVYFYKLETANTKLTTKATLLR